jgi:hypothetical protein
MNSGSADLIPIVKLIDIIHTIPDPLIGTTGLNAFEGRKTWMRIIKYIRIS